MTTAAASVPSTSTSTSTSGRLENLGSRHGSSRRCWATRPGNLGAVHVPDLLLLLLAPPSHLYLPPSSAARLSLPRLAACTLFPARHLRHRVSWLLHTLAAKLHVCPTTWTHPQHRQRASDYIPFLVPNSPQAAALTSTPPAWPLETSPGCLWTSLRTILS